MMQPAVFLDRDGTIIELVHHLTDPADVRLIDGAAQAIADLRAARYRIVLVTNQSVIGRGLLTESGLADVHTVMSKLLLDAAEAVVDDIYFCPLKPGVKDPTVIEDPMRKPGPGMLLQAARDHQLDLARSWMVGDTVSDMWAGRHAGCKTMLVKTGYGENVNASDPPVDYSAPDLYAASQTILNERAS